VGTTCPQFVFANNQDFAYGRFLLDPVSRKGAIADRELSPIHLRACFALGIAVGLRPARPRWTPLEYIDLALRNLPAENDEALAQSIIGRTITALHRYVSPEVRAQLVAENGSASG